MSLAKIFACGDVVNYSKKDGTILSPEMEEIVKEADYSVCNFEAPIAGVGTPQLKSGPHHCQRVETIAGLKNQGFDLLLLANNHMMDFGALGLEGTMDEAGRHGFDVVGAGVSADMAYRPLVKTLNGIRVGILNACEAQFGGLDYFKSAGDAGYAWINHSEIDLAIIRLRKECDFVIVFAHAGLEHYSLPQKEWRSRYKHFCDLGADAVVGSHPHVPQGFERYSKSMIFYSLGNFYFDSKRFAERPDSSYSVVLKLHKGMPIDFELVYHLKRDGLVRVAGEHERIDITNLNNLLCEEVYAKEHDLMTMKAYDQISTQLKFSIVRGVFGGGVKASLRRLALTILGRRKKQDRELKQLHLLRNEAYYHVIRHALEIKCQVRAPGK